MKANIYDYNQTYFQIVEGNQDRILFIKKNGSKVKGDNGNVVTITDPEGTIYQYTLHDIDTPSGNTLQSVVESIYDIIHGC